ncbi:MAG TPA: hypothetical protein VK644_01080 [Chitinophagaceae bacterium]|nr:hypothetical protein [Chitinophagaceae bacterium]
MRFTILSTFIETATLIAVLAVLFLAGQIFILKRFVKGAPKGKRRNQQVEAKAIVLAVEETGVYMNKQPLMKLQMQVIPEKGRNFITETKQVLSPLDLEEIRSGSTVRVKYNTGNQKEIALVRPTSDGGTKKIITIQ